MLRTHPNNAPVPLTDSDMIGLIKNCINLEMNVLKNNNILIISDIKRDAINLVKSGEMTYEIAFIQTINRTLKDENHTDHEKTILHYAALYGNTELIEDLFANRACRQCIDVDALDENGNTPLYIAIRNILQKSSDEKFKILEILMRNGADPGMVNKQGITPLLLVLTHPEKLPKENEVFKKIIEILLGIPTSSEFDAFGFNSHNSRENLHVERTKSCKNSPTSAYHISKEALYTLNDAEKDFNGFNALLAAAMRSDVSITTLGILLKQPQALQLLNTPCLIMNEVHVAEKDPNQIEFFKETRVNMLYLAAKNNRLKKVLLLLSTPGIDATMGKTITMPNFDKNSKKLTETINESPLDIASQNKHVNVKNLLACYLELDKNLKTNSLSTPLFSTLCNQYTIEIVTQALSAMVKNGNFKLDHLKKLLPANLSKNESSIDHTLLMHRTVELDQIELLQQLCCLYPISLTSKYSIDALDKIALQHQSQRVLRFMNIHQELIVCLPSPNQIAIEINNENEYPTDSIYREKALESLMKQQNLTKDQLIQLTLTLYKNGAVYSFFQLINSLTHSGKITFFELKNEIKNDSTLLSIIEGYELIYKMIKGEIDTNNLKKFVTLSLPNNFKDFIQLYIKFATGADEPYRAVVNFHKSRIVSALIYHAITNNNPELLQQMLSVPGVNLAIRNEDNLPPLQLAEKLKHEKCVAILSAYELISDSFAVENEVLANKNDQSANLNFLTESGDEDDDRKLFVLDSSHPLPNDVYITDAIYSAVDAMLAQHKNIYAIPHSKIFKMVDELFYAAKATNTEERYDKVRNHLAQLCASVFLFDAIKQNDDRVVRKLLFMPEVNVLFPISDKETPLIAAIKSNNKDIYAYIFCFLIIDANEKGQSLDKYRFNQIEMPSKSFETNIDFISNQYVMENPTYKDKKFEDKQIMIKMVAANLVQDLLPLAIKSKSMSDIKELLGLSFIHPKQDSAVFSNQVNATVKLAETNIPAATPLLSCYFLLEAFILKFPCTIDISKISNENIAEALPLLTKKYESTHAAGQLNVLQQKSLAYKNQPLKFLQSLQSYMLNPNFSNNNNLGAVLTNPQQRIEPNKK